MAAHERLPDLLDVKRVMDETGMKRASAEKIMRALPIVRLPDLRKNYVKREDLRRLIDESTTVVKR